jgi:transcriptional regulator with XRE-family HTH domain
MNIFECKSYKNLIKEKLTELKSINSKYTFEALAKAMNIHKPYLSRVLNQKGDFNKDQLFLCAKFLKLTELETEYFYFLFEENTCYVPERKNQLAVRLEEYTKRSLKSDSLYSSQSSKNHQIARSDDYFMDPYFPLIHMFLLIPKFAENPSHIADTLGLSPEKTLEYIENLHFMKIIEKKNNKINILKEFIHLPENSILITAFRNLSKMKALDRITSSSSDDYLSLHVFFTSDEAARKKIQKLFLEFLDTAKKISDKSKSEEVYQLNFDLLKWS